jgi:hypothetical protein
MVRNLLGHFTEVDVYMAPVSRYANDELSGCDRAIYMGTYFEGKMPDAFLADAARYRKPFLWMNYNIWKLQQKLGPQRFRTEWGFEYRSIDGNKAPARGEMPAFYNKFAYKGATFRKVAQLDAQGQFLGHAEIVVVKNHSAAVLSEATHSASGAKTPYALRKGDFFYVADNPVSVIDERDRYLILADLLFDVLKLPPRSEKRYAVVRIEDIHPGYDLRLLHMTIEVFRKRKLPFAISLIPRYVGPGTKGGLDTTQDAKFLSLIRYAVENGASILVHGYEHHLTIDLGCGISFTGEGYEFWDVCKNRPLPFDSDADRGGRKTAGRGMGDAALRRLAAGDARDPRQFRPRPAAHEIFSRRAVLERHRQRHRPVFPLHHRLRLRRRARLAGEPRLRAAAALRRQTAAHRRNARDRAPQQGGAGRVGVVLLASGADPHRARHPVAGETRRWNPRAGVRIRLAAGAEGPR